jgi:hypothetical protein
MRCSHLGGVLKLGFTSSFVPISQIDDGNNSAKGGEDGVTLSIEHASGRVTFWLGYDDRHTQASCG